MRQNPDKTQELLTKCAYEVRYDTQLKDTSKFIQEAIALHKNKYNYSKVKYTGAHRKVTIMCGEHGKFEQTPRSHLNGRGCPRCKQGENHPRYGKPSPSTGYYGRFKGNTFRSLSELFWMLDAEKSGVEYIALDQVPHRENWQVSVVVNNRKSNYCPDFYLTEENIILDIKPKWRMKRESEKLDQAKRHYTARGIQFQLLDCNEIKIDKKIVRKLHENRDIFLYPASVKRLKNTK